MVGSGARIEGDGNRGGEVKICFVLTLAAQTVFSLSSAQAPGLEIYATFPGSEAAKFGLVGRLMPCAG